MYLIDTSAWVEYFRRTESPTDLLVTRLMGEQAPVVLTEPVIMEVLAGARDQSELIKLERLTEGLPLVRVDAVRDFVNAAHTFRAARSRGVTVRKMLDCLIAAVAMRAGATVVHRDADFANLTKVIPTFEARSQ
ncbi:PIN domain nuclease [Streptosporangiaceae bacterium NEAU-GS5]|nr:PIN domain nuclease [Streptosporangiaceae bacterium NEAU-GS5]